MRKETYWSKFSDDLEERTNCIVGKHDMEIIEKHVIEKNNLGKTLELGCGTGTYSRILMNTSKELTATDLSQKMVAATKGLLADGEKVCVEQADCFALSYPDCTFDTVFIANLLHVVPESEKVVREAGRVLKRHGRLIIVSFTFEGMTLFNKLGMIYRYLRFFGKPSPDAHTMTVKETREILEDNGFRIKEAGLIGNRSKTVFIDAQAV